MVATVPMSAVMLASQQLGLLGEQPPERWTEAVLASVGGSMGSEGAEDALAVLAHLGVGAGGGAAYALVRRIVPERVPPVVAGAVFGIGMWALAYGGLAPWLSVLPSPSKDRPGRPATMALAHVVYGGVLGALCGRRTS